MRYGEVIARLKAEANPDNVAGMARFGIRPARAFGVSMPVLKKMAREIGKDHAMALKLWASAIHEARVLAAMIDDPVQVSQKQMDSWAADFDSWAVCDSTCGYLFDKSPFAWEKALQWSGRREEFVKRAGFALMAWLAVHDKRAEDEKFIPMLEIIEREASDGRNFVRKAVNWALRQIGKRNKNLHKLALETARRIRALDSTHARWVASDALLELTSEKVLKIF